MGKFVIFILALFVLAALLRIDFFFTILYLFGGVYILSQLWTRRIFACLQVTRSLPRRAFLGDQVTVRLGFKNLSRLPIPWLVMNESFPVILSAPPFYRQVITLGGRASYTTQYTLTARKRGFYQIGPLALQTGDLLGVKRQLTSQIEADYLIVYPKIVPISQLGLPTHSPQVILPTPIPLFPDPSRLTGVRDYIPGDNPRHIHWSATATTGRILVKQFQPAIARDNAIFLNLSRRDYAERGYPEPAVELAITVAASLANHMIAIEKLPVGLTTTALDPLVASEQQFKLPPRKGRGQLMQILEVLARVQNIDDDPYFLESVRREAVYLSWGTTIILITSHPSVELAKTVLFLKQSGFQVTLVLVDPLRKRRQTREEPPQELGIPVFKIRQEKDVEAWSPVL
jgi:uncharacterized protein (DUF58 family)